jgi:hypothetical protein
MRPILDGPFGLLRAKDALALIGDEHDLDVVGPCAIPSIRTTRLAV